MRNITLVCILMIFTVTGCKSFSRKSSPGAVDTLFADTVSEVVEPVDSAALFEELESYRVGPGSEATQAARPQEPLISNTGNRYHMIVGCFAIPENADSYAEKLRGMGYSTTILRGDNNLQMVSVRSYGTYEESIAEIAKFRYEINPGAWVYVNR
ncbi:MAG: SPOR domain-containing protein [Bacteroidales bacterium]|nr:SPOR domain-containing protein [Bacteroidales bacterium]